MHIVAPLVMLWRFSDLAEPTQTPKKLRKNFILDVWLGSEYVSVLEIKSFKRNERTVSSQSEFEFKYCFVTMRDIRL